MTTNYLLKSNNVTTDHQTYPDSLTFLAFEAKIMSQSDW